MTQKFYFRAATPAASPTTGEKASALPSGTANDQSGGVEHSLSGTIGTSETTHVGTLLAQTTRQDMYCLRFSSAGLAAGTKGSGTWTLGINAFENAAASNAFAELSIYFWRPSTNAVVGHVYAATTALGTEVNSAGKSGRVLTVTGSNVTIANDDILVVELWYQAIQGMASATTVTTYYDGTTEPTAASAELSTASYINAPADLALAPISTPQTLTATVTQTAATTRVKSFLRTLAVVVAQAVTATRIKALRKTLAVTASQTPAISRSLAFLKLLSVTQSQARTAVRSVAKPFTVTETQTPTASRLRAFLRTLAVTQAQASTVARSMAKTFSFTQTQTRTLGATRAFLRTLSVTHSQTMSGVRSIGKRVVVTHTQLGAFVRSVTKTLSATVTQTRSLGVTKAKNVLLTVTQSQAATAVRTVGRIVSVVQTGTTTTVRSVGKVVAVTHAQSSAITRSIGKVISLVTQTVTAALNAAQGPPVPGYALWLDGSDTSTLTTGGGVVSAWADKSANGWDVSGTAQDSGHTLNGLNTVTMGAAGTDTLTNTSVTCNTNTGTWFIVLRPLNVAGSPAYARILAFHQSGQLDYNNTSSVIPFLRNASTSNATTWYNSASRISPQGTLTDNVATLLTTQRNGDTFAMRQDGASVGGSTGSGTAAFNFAAVTVGNSTQAVGECLKMDVAEVIWYPDFLSSTDVDSVETYLLAKWLSGGTIFNQALNVTVTQALTVVRSIIKVVSATQSKTVSTVRSTGKTVSKTQTQTPTGSRSMSKSFTATVTQAVTRSISGMFHRTLSAVHTQTVSARRAMTKTFSLIQTHAVTGSRSVGKVASVTQSQAATAVRSIGKVLSRTATQTVSTARSTGKLLSAAQTQVGTVARGIAKSLSVAQSATASARKAMSQVLSVVQSQFPSMSRLYGITRNLLITLGTLRSRWSLSNLVSRWSASEPRASLWSFTRIRSRWFSDNPFSRWRSGPPRSR